MSDWETRKVLVRLFFARPLVGYGKDGLVSVGLSRPGHNCIALDDIHTIFLVFRNENYGNRRAHNKIFTPTSRLWYLSGVLVCHVEVYVPLLVPTA